jgi:hypothetical protein
MVWWVWVLFGLGLLGVEVLTPGGFFVLFFGIGALVVGVLVAIGLGGPLWGQWLLFSALSTVCLLLFRGRLLTWSAGHGARRVDDSLEGEIATPFEDLAPGAVGKAELRGTTWTARNADARTLAKGERCRVVRVDGLMLVLRGE